MKHWNPEVDVFSHLIQLELLALLPHNKKVPTGMFSPACIGLLWLF